MTTEQRLQSRLDLLSDFCISVDVMDQMVYFHYNRKLDCTLHYLKNISKARFNTLLENAQETYCKFHKTDDYGTGNSR